MIRRRLLLLAGTITLILSSFGGVAAIAAPADTITGLRWQQTSANTAQLSWNFDGQEEIDQQYVLALTYQGPSDYTTTYTSDDSALVNVQPGQKVTASVSALQGKTIVAEKESTTYTQPQTYTSSTPAASDPATVTPAPAATSFIWLLVVALVLLLVLAALAIFLARRWRPAHAKQLVLADGTALDDVPETVPVTVHGTQNTEAIEVVHVPVVVEQPSSAATPFPAQEPVLLPAAEETPVQSEVVREPTAEETVVEDKPVETVEAAAPVIEERAPEAAAKPVEEEVEQLQDEEITPTEAEVAPEPVAEEAPVEEEPVEVPTEEEPEVTPEPVVEEKPEAAPESVEEPAAPVTAPEPVKPVPAAKPFPGVSAREKRRDRRGRKQTTAFVPFTIEQMQVEDDEE